MTILPRETKNGTVYFIRVSLGYINGKQQTKGMTYRPEKGMSPRAIEKELNRQAVLFEEKAKQDYEQQLQREADKQEQERIQREKEENEIEYAKKHMTFQELAEEWVSLQEETHELKNSSLLRMKSCRQRTYKAIGNVLVSNLTYRKIQSFITSLGRNGVNQKTGLGLSKKTQKHYLTFISDVLIFAKKSGIVNDNPCHDISFSKSPTKEIEIYSLDEAKKLLAAIDDKAPLKYKLFFNLLAYCGMRRGEALGLEYKDINYGTSVLTISRTSNYHQGYGVYTDTPKTKSSYRSLYIQPKILTLIKLLQAEQKQQAIACGDQWVNTDRLFIKWNGEPLHPSAPYKWLKRFCEHENLPFKALHSFRHFVASQALASGVDAKSVSSMLGHSQTSTTLNIYAHVIQQTNENALNSIANLLEK